MVQSRAERETPQHATPPPRRERRGRGSLSTWLLVGLLLVIPCWSKYGDINEDCKKRLTELDSHMSAYVGTVHDLIGEHESGEEYRYVIGVCMDVSPLNEPDPYQFCGAVQFSSNHTHSHCLGNVTKAQIARSRDGVWIELTYTEGDRYNNHCSRTQRMARIMFLCDPAINGNGDLDFLEENNEDGLCYYMFSLAAKTVCGYPGNLSVGDIILILAAVLAAVWLLAMVGGLLFKRFILGAKGWEQVPLIDWYKAFGNLEADGCDLVCRTRSTKLVEYREPSFGADTDEEDDEKDDNLLPM